MHTHTTPYGQAPLRTAQCTISNFRLNTAVRAQILGQTGTWQPAGRTAAHNQPASAQARRYWAIEGRPDYQTTHYHLYHPTGSAPPPGSARSGRPPTVSPSLHRVETKRASMRSNPAARQKERLGDISGGHKPCFELKVQQGIGIWALARRLKVSPPRCGQTLRQTEQEGKGLETAQRNTS